MDTLTAIAVIAGTLVGGIVAVVAILNCHRSRCMMKNGQISASVSDSPSSATALIRVAEAATLDTPKQTPRPPKLEV